MGLYDPMGVVTTMTEFTDGFESALPGNWTARVGAFTVTDKFERDLDEPYAGTYCFRKPFNVSANQNAVAWALGETFQTFDLYFYARFFYSGETLGTPLYVDMYMDDGASNDGTPSFQSAANLADNFFGVTVKYDYNQVYTTPAYSHQIDVKYRKAGGSVTTLFTFYPTSAHMPLDLDTNQWFGFRLQVTSSRVRLYADWGDGNWSLLNSVANSSYISSNLSNLVVGLTEATGGDVASDEQPAIDAIRIGTGGDITSIGGAVSGLNLGNLAEEQGGPPNTFGFIDAYSKIGGGGRAKLSIVDYHTKNYTTVKSNRGKAVDVSESTYNNVILRGEVDEFEPTGKDGYILGVQEAGQKLIKQPCTSNLILLDREAKHVQEGAILDDESPFSVSWTGYAVTMAKANSQKTIVYPYSVTHTDNIVGNTPTSTDDVDVLHFNNFTFDSSNMVYYRSDNLNGESESIYSLFLFRIWKKTGTSVTGYRLKIQAFFDDESPTGIVDHPYFSVRDYVTGLPPYDDITPDLEDFITSFSSNNVYSHETDLQFAFEFGDPSELLNDESSSNANDFELFTLGIWMYNPQLDDDVGYAVWGVPFMELEVIFDGDQSPETALSMVDATTTISKLVLDNTTPSWGLSGFPLTDGFGSGDRVIVTKWLDDQIVDIFNDSDVTFNLDWNVTGSDEVTETSDISDMSIYRFLQKWCAILNAVWWYDGNTNTIVVRSLDQLSSSGITITEADIIGKFAGLVYTETTDLIRDYVEVRGLYHTKTVTVSPEVTMGMGLTKEVYVDTSLINQQSVDSMANKKAIVHKYTQKRFSFSIDLDNPIQSYAGIEKGVTLAIDVDDEEGVQRYNFTSGGSGEVVVVGLRYYTSQENNSKQILTVDCQRRYVS